jgi:hypothetical protein
MTPSSAPPVLRVTDVAELVATVPVLLGFRPSESLVLICTGGPSGRRLGLTLRIDLPPPGHVAVLAEQVATSLLAGDPAGAVLVVYAAGDGPVRRDVVAAVDAALAARGVPVRTAVWAERAGSGAAWACFDGCCSGVLPDPGATAAAAEAVAAGHVVRADRAALERLVAPTDPVALLRREERLVATTGVRPDDAPAALARLVRALEESAAGEFRATDDAVVALAVALTHPRVRDRVLLRCAEAHAEAGAAATAPAEGLFALLCRELPDPEAAEAAALLAACALLRGDGALANVALARAERSWPGHRLTGLLREAAERAVHPRELRASLLRLREVRGEDGA